MANFLSGALSHSIKQRKITMPMEKMQTKQNYLISSVILKAEFPSLSSFFRCSRLFFDISRPFFEDISSCIELCFKRSNGFNCCGDFHVIIFVFLKSSDENEGQRHSIFKDF